MVYTFEDLHKNFSVDLFASIKTYGQTEIRYTSISMRENLFEYCV